MSYYPDLAVPGAVETVGGFAGLAVERGVPRLVLLAGRGEEEAEQAEDAVRESGAELTIVRSTWFAQNFSEDYMLDGVLAGEVALPAEDTPEPFVDADDIADVAVAALTGDGHVGELYELTGRRALSFAEAVAEISRAAGREVRYVPVSLDQFAAGAAEEGVPSEVIERCSVTCSERSSTAAIPPPPTASSAPSVARHGTSASSPATPLPQGSGTRDRGLDLVSGAALIAMG